MKQQKNIQKVQNTQKPQQTKKASANISDFFERNKKLFLWISLAIGVLMSIFMFDVKADLSGDDCDYVLYADRFCHNFTFPGFRGPLYPIILSPFVLIFGVNLVVLKALSAVFILLSIWLLYKSFCNKIKAIILMPAIFLVCICSYVFFYASYTYSEPFFMLVQSLFIYFFSQYFLTDEEQIYTIKKDWRKYLILGALILAMGLTRSVGFGIIGALILYFALKLRWRDMFYTLSATGIVFFAFQIFKKIVWSTAGSAYDLQNYLAKNYYNINQGMEDLAGFFNRLIENSNIYLSKFLYMFMGLRPEDTQFIAPFLTVIIYVLFIVFLITVFKKSKSLLFTGIYVAVMNFASFVILQSNWQQDRLIMIYYPLIILFLLGGLYYFVFTIKKLRILRFVFPLMIAIMILGNISHSSKKINRNLPVLQRNISGNMLAGLTPDWSNFILMSKWVAANIDKNDKVVSRKASMSYIYTGRQFEGMSSVPSQLIDSLPVVAPEGKSILVVDIGKQQSVTLAPELQYVINGFVPLNDSECNLAGLYFVDTAELKTITNEIGSFGIKYTSDATQFKNSCNEAPDKVSVYCPDQLVENLNNRNIKYLILASIRLNPKTAQEGRIINTIHNYIAFINMKYPDKFKKIHEIGTSEKCELVEYLGITLNK